MTSAGEKRDPYRYVRGSLSNQTEQKETSHTQLLCAAMEHGRSPAKRWRPMGVVLFTKGRVQLGVVTRWGQRISAQRMDTRLVCKDLISYLQELPALFLVRLYKSSAACLAVLR